MAETPKFVADVMLGSLAKWLRVLGYDTLYDNQIRDEQIIQFAQAENRLALTRDSRLVQRRCLNYALLIRSDQLPEQLTQVLTWLGETVHAEKILTRCLRCNVPLQQASKPELKGSLPVYVYRTQCAFKRCPHCRKVYWAGTHRSHMYQRLQHWLGVKELFPTSE